MRVLARGRWLVVLLLVGFDPSPVIGPEFESVLRDLLADPATPPFEGARIERDRVVLSRGDGRVELVHPTVGGAACGPFGLMRSSLLSSEERTALCDQLAELEDPFHRPVPSATPRDAVVSGTPERWTYDRPPTTTPIRFAAVAGALTSLALGGLGMLGWRRRKDENDG